MKTFRQAVKSRDAKFKEYEKLEAKLEQLKSEIIEIEHTCVSLKRWGDKFERKIHFSINFSGYED